MLRKEDKLPPTATTLMSGRVHNVLAPCYSIVINPIPSSSVVLQPQLKTEDSVSVRVEGVYCV